MTGKVEIHAGNIYLPVEIYDKYFSGLETVAILERDGCIMLMPLHIEGGGGMLLKIRNSRGDRVIHAREFLSSLNIDESETVQAKIQWETETAGLRLEYAG